MKEKVNLLHQFAPYKIEYLYLLLTASSNAGANILP